MIQRSRFICALHPARTDEQAASFIDGVRKENWSATHNCTAFRIGPHGEQQRSSDDGEPSGTAGVPMLQVLVAREVTDTVAVVTRYFGGVKLGAGGLVRAYGRCVAEALDAVGTLDLVPYTSVTIRADHASAGRLEHDLRAAGHHITDVDFGPRVTLHLVVPTADLPVFRPWLAQVSAGAAVAETGGETLRAVPTTG